MNINDVIVDEIAKAMTKHHDEQTMILMDTRLTSLEVKARMNEANTKFALAVCEIMAKYS